MTMNVEKAVEQLKLQGLDRAINNHKPDFLRAQEIAELLGKVEPVIDIDMVRDAFLQHHSRQPNWGNAAGGIFRDTDKWEMVGHKKSTRPKSQGRWILTWRRKSS